MKRFLTVLLVVSLLSGCGGGALSLLTGGGPKVAANVQAGQTNSQTVGQTRNSNVKVTRSPNSTIRPVERPSTFNENQGVENVINNTTNIPPWFIIALVVWSIILWQLPSPDQLRDRYFSLRKRNKNN